MYIYCEVTVYCRHVIMALVYVSVTVFCVVLVTEGLVSEVDMRSSLICDSEINVFLILFYITYVHPIVQGNILVP